MPGVSSAATASPAFQQGFAQLKVQQARRNAEQAEVTARALQTQAANASRAADQAQENARDLTVRSDQAQLNAGRAREGLEAVRSLSQTSNRLERIYERVADAQKAGTTAEPVGGAVPTAAPTAPVVPAASVVAPAPAPVATPGPTNVNAFGQETGTVISTIA